MTMQQAQLHVNECVNRRLRVLWTALDSSFGGVSALRSGGAGFNYGQRNTRVVLSGIFCFGHG